MKYVYVLDYNFDHIYEIIINKEDVKEFDKDPERYLYKYYHIKESTSSWLISNKKLEIETIDKIK